MFTARNCEVINVRMGVGGVSDRTQLSTDVLHNTSQQHSESPHSYKDRVILQLLTMLQGNSGTGLTYRQHGVQAVFLPPVPQFNEFIITSTTVCTTVVLVIHTNMVEIKITLCSVKIFHGEEWMGLDASVTEQTVNLYMLHYWYNVKNCLTSSWAYNRQTIRTFIMYSLATLKTFFTSSTFGLTLWDGNIYSLECWVHAQMCIFM